MLHSINHEQKLYVLTSGNGYSCLGFEVAERKRVAVRKWLGLDASPEEAGTPAHWRSYENAMSLGAAHYTITKDRCPADLEPALIGLEGKRVEVTAPDGTRNRFYVGKSTGWMPCHLEIKRRDSTGGGAVYLPEGSTVRIIGTR